MDDYNSKYPLEYYELGKPYRFYGTNTIGEPASNDYIKKYRSYFDSLPTENVVNNSGTSKQRLGFNRFVGVVVEKHFDSHPKISVMFQNNNYGVIEFRVKKYIVSSSGVETDGRNIMEAETMLHLQAEGGTKKNRTSGITKASGNSKTSGITSTKGKVLSGKSKISGITSTKKAERVSGITKA